MLTHRSPRIGSSHLQGDAVPGPPTHLLDLLTRPGPPAAGSAGPDPEPGSATEPGDDRVPAGRTAAPGRLGTADSGEGPRPLVGLLSLPEQLRQVEIRLLAEACGDPAAEREVRRYFAVACSRFETARVRRFLPILVEREVRQRLRDAVGSAPGPADVP